MAVNILRRGSEGKDVERWQLFLVGQGLLKGSIDGEFGPATENASKAFQRAHGLSADGIVGPKSFGIALGEGFDIGFADPRRDGAEAILPDPSESALKPLASTAARQQLFGPLKFQPAPTAGNPEAIRILPTWEADNIQSIKVPQLVGKLVFGTPSKGGMRFHKLAVPQLLAMWAAWESAGLLGRVLTYEGSFEPRFVRGSTTELSNHAFGTAFDINAKWNPLGAVPALAGREGSVRELVGIANEHGFFWGGHFKSRPDGMHFEVAKIV
jgi:D-alanyl-D-alanine carboxypeptidase-like protein/putative peptidoglycan binding protein